MFSQDLITQLAAELHQSEHFSKRFPDMTVADGYTVSREWVKSKVAGGAKVRGHMLGGSFTRPTGAATGDTFHADYGPLGAISMRFM